MDPSRDGSDGVLCVLRAIMDGVPDPSPPHRPRLVIDYVTTLPAARGRGLATLLVDFVVEASRVFGANTYVLAIEESCVYWMGKSFILERSETLNARLNIFSDTHLLRREGDPDDPGSKEDLDLSRDDEDDGSGEGQEDESSGKESEEEELGDEHDTELQAALALSLADGGTLTRGASPTCVAADSEEADLQAALAMSVGSSATTPDLPPTSGDKVGRPTYANEDDPELQAALAMSLEER
eukprot:TRINITY_DN49534_c0_g1_i1.p1 TRINITY_DN49534_c0_g1~~TRINITY_DN49534_c0_g1_i1.p1  ORF type:complete len:240 (+),score=47.50 TRINITY_DN49534_c0_g1_i1:2-721(+)